MTLKRENVLIEALPYIRKFHNAIMVIKVGGHAMVDKQIMSDIIEDVVLLKFVGIHPIIVHGGGPEIPEKMNRMGKKPRAGDHREDEPHGKETQICRWITHHR